MYFSLAISMYQGTEIAFKNVLYLGFLQSIKTRNLRALLTRSENTVLGNIFTSLCCNYDTRHTCERSFWLIKPSFSESDVNMSNFSADFLAASARKSQFYFFVVFLKMKNSQASFSLIFENSLPKGFSWQNMKKSVISVLKINSRYLQSPGLILPWRAFACLFLVSQCSLDILSSLSASSILLVGVANGSSKTLAFSDWLGDEISST